uniref:Uncharacterized protein n=1 Tax=Acrobeloides nanus TaxID=290746 RepID=A0A914C975_9BILA
MPLNKHEASVEDVQWSATEEDVGVYSVDRSNRLWDTRARPADACVHTVANAHDKDVNVLSWNKFDPLLVIGSDDAVLKVWSLKTIQYNEPVARFKHHKGPITSVEWNLSYSSCIRKIPKTFY